MRIGGIRCRLSECVWQATVLLLLQWLWLLLAWHHPRRQVPSLSVISDDATAWRDPTKGLFLDTPPRTDPELMRAPPLFASLPPDMKVEFPSTVDTPPVNWVVFYHIFIPKNPRTQAQKARAIVREQLYQIRQSYAAQRCGYNRTLVLYTVVGERILSNDMQDWCQPHLRCVNVQSLGRGYEDKTLRAVHAYCSHPRQANHNVTVTYLHNKGSHHNRGGANDAWRRHMTMAVTSQSCLDSVASSSSSCHVCGLLFQAIPSPHFPGNFWTAQCQYVRQLLAPSVFTARLDKTLDAMDQWVEEGILTRQLYDDNREDWTTGRGRYAHEQWIAAHPNIRPCDVSATNDLRFWKTAGRSIENKDWQMVPRRPLRDKLWRIVPRPNVTVIKNTRIRRTDYHLLPGLMVRWRNLYGRLPPPDSWAWAHMPDGYYWREWANQLDRSPNTSQHSALAAILFPDVSRESTRGLPNQQRQRQPSDSSVMEQAVVPWTIFYHVYVPNNRNVSHIIDEQLQSLQASHAVQSVNGTVKVYYSLVGNVATDNQPNTMVARVCQRYDRLQCEMSAQAKEGNEDITLTQMHQFCVAHPEQSVLYFHSKGSFHDSTENQYWRRHLLSAITSRDCLERIATQNASLSTSTTHDPSVCNVCGLQFYPVWAFFFPGNFFTSRCSYIAKLLPPQSFGPSLAKVVEEMLHHKKRGNFFRTDLYNPRKEDNLGLDRYAWEQWVGSHPSLRPCDLSTTANVRHWVGQPIRQKHGNQTELEWSLAPRHDVWAPWYRIQTGKRQRLLLDPSTPDGRLGEYFLLAGSMLKWTRLYQTTPPNTSWIYEWFPDGALWRQGVATHGTSVIDVLLQAHADGVGNLTRHLVTDTAAEM